VYGVSKVHVVLRLHPCSSPFHNTGQSAPLQYDAPIPGNDEDCVVAPYNGFVSIRFILHEATWTSHAVIHQDS
jgi:hypothetical protein